MIREAVGNLVANFKIAGPTGEWVPDLDDDRSQFPQDIFSGVAQLSTASIYQIVSAYSAFWFKPETVIIANDAGAVNKVVFYNGPSQSATMFAMYLKACDTVFLQRDQLRGIFITSGVWISNLVPSVTVRVGGKLIASLPTGQI